MVVLTGTRSARALPWLRLAALLPISLLVGHEAVFALQYGIGESLRAAMRAGGHDGYWIAFSIVVSAITVGVLGREIARFSSLRRRIRASVGLGADVPRGALTAGTSATWRREFASIWPALFVATAAAFLVQENLEHVAAGQAPHGLGSLIGGEHPLAIPVLGLISAIVAAAGALVRWRVRGMEARVARARFQESLRRPTLGLAPAREWPPLGALRAHAWFLVRLLAGRAPPSIA